LADLLTRVRTILDDQFVGLYLYGSLATGDFNPYQSDIDFIVVTASDLADQTIADLESMHMQPVSSGKHWVTKLEGAYVPQHALRRYDPHQPPVPTINEGQFYLGKQGSDWIIQRHILREFGASVAGPNIAGLIDPVQPDDLRASIQAALAEWWKPMVEDPTRLERPEYQPYAVLSMCRALYTLEHGETVSKVDAASWAIRELNPKWKDLIHRAMGWRRGEPMGNIAATVEFMKYALAKAKRVRWRSTTSGRVGA